MIKFFITTPIYYPNARPHVGSAYTTIVCDVIARYKRMCGYDVAFLTGTDEHGEKLRRAAEDAGMRPEDFVAEKRELFKNLWRTLGIPQHSPERPCGYRFVHTSQNPDHVKSVHWMIRQAQKAGYIEKRKYEGRYCVFDERYVSDSTEPANCDICGRPAELISEENYFFKLSAFQEKLLKLYEDHPEFVLPDYRRNEVTSFVKSGLRDISISRKRLKWGIPWPDDDRQVVYVWYDALTSYLTGIGFRGEERSADFEKYWMGDDAEIVHMIGKDILRFHAVYWPAFLMAAGLPLPKTIFAHGWIYYEQDKMSKSKGNVVYPEPIIEALNSFGAPGNDALRYYLLRDTPFGQDASFSYGGLIQRYNSDLANDLGNLASRVTTMMGRYFGGRLPGDFGTADIRPEEKEIQELTDRTVSEFRQNFDRFDLAGAVEAIWRLVAKINKFIVEEQPWNLAPGLPLSDPARLAVILHTVAQAMHSLAVVLYPIFPVGAARLWGEFGGEGELAEQRVRDLRFEDLKWQTLKPGTQVGKPEPIFPRLDKAATLAKLEELAQADRERDKVPGAGKASEEVSTDMQDETSKVPGGSATPTPSPESRVPSPDSPLPTPESPVPSPEPKISIEDFAKVEMRAGEVVSAERIPKADKLLKIMVDIGTEVRQVLAGIAEYYEPEKLVGMKVVVVTNLQPRKMRGLESNGMIVAASVGEEGRPVLATFTEDVPKGAKLK
jgi:methionyl-tRNA synthetase